MPPVNTPVPVAPAPQSGGLDPVSSQYYSSRTDGTSGQTGTTNQQQANAYTPGQQALQAFLPSQMQSILSGQSNVPNYFTAPQQVFDTYNANFNHFAQPQYEAQYGTGSPQGAAARALGNQNLAAQLYQTGFGNYLNAANSAAGMAYTPVGQNQQSQANYDYTNSSNVNGAVSNSIFPTILSQVLAQLLHGLV